MHNKKKRIFISFIFLSFEPKTNNCHRKKTKERIKKQILAFFSNSTSALDEIEKKNHRYKSMSTNEKKTPIQVIVCFYSNSYIRKQNEGGGGENNGSVMGKDEF